MKRLSSQLIITETAELLKNSIVEISENSVSYHSIFDGNHEKTNTVFYDGILSPPIVSLSMRAINRKEIEQRGFNIFRFEDFEAENLLEDKKCIVDFGTEDLLIINDLIRRKQNLLCHFNSIDFIIACTALPCFFITNTDRNNAKRILWTNTNLIAKKITGQTIASIV